MKREPAGSHKGGQFARDTSGATNIPTSSDLTQKETPSLPADIISSVNKAWEAYKANPGKHTYEPWPVDPSIGVCGVCGKEADANTHIPAEVFPYRDPRYLPYEDAMWKWTAANGGVPSNYGGLDSSASMMVRIHLTECGIDKTRSTLPRLDQVSEVTDTDAPNTTVDISAALITCECGAMKNIQWRLVQDKTVNEIVFEVVQKGDMATPDVQMSEPDERLKLRIKQAVEKAVSLQPDKEKLRQLYTEKIIPALWKASYAGRLADHRFGWGHRGDVTPDEDEEMRKWAWVDVAGNLNNDFSADYLIPLVNTEKDENGRAKEEFPSNWFR